MYRRFPLCLYFSSSSSCFNCNALSLPNHLSESLSFHFLRVFPDPSKKLFLPSPSIHRSLDALACPPCCFVSFLSWPLQLACSWRAESFPYLYSHPSPRGLIARYAANVTALNCPDEIDITRGRGSTGWQRWHFAFPNGCYMAQEPHVVPTLALPSKPLHVCSLLLETSCFGTLLTTL